MLSEERIEQNKQEFLFLINSIEREFDKERLVKWLERSDFFIAPASAKYHGSCKGGLCEHSLNVYYSLLSLRDKFLPNSINDDSLKIVGLLHNASKANYYETYFRNVKDENGKWIQVQEYKVRDDRFIYGSQEQTAEFMVSTFIPLEVQERVAILHQLGGQGHDSTQVNMGTIFGEYPLATLLHTADLLSTFILENEKCFQTPEPKEVEESEEKVEEVREEEHDLS